MLSGAALWVPAVSPQLGSERLRPPRRPDHANGGDFEEGHCGGVALERQSLRLRLCETKRRRRRQGEEDVGEDQELRFCEGGREGGHADDPDTCSLSLSNCLEVNKKRNSLENDFVRKSWKEPCRIKYFKCFSSFYESCLAWGKWRRVHQRRKRSSFGMSWGETIPMAKTDRRPFEFSLNLLEGFHFDCFSLIFIAFLQLRSLIWIEKTRLLHVLFLGRGREGRQRRVAVLQGAAVTSQPLGLLHRSEGEYVKTSLSFERFKHFKAIKET